MRREKQSMNRTEDRDRRINGINVKITKSCKDGPASFLLCPSKKIQRTRTARRRRKIHDPNDKWVSNCIQSTNYKRKRKRRRATNIRMYTGSEWRASFAISPGAAISGAKTNICGWQPMIATTVKDKDAKRCGSRGETKAKSSPS